MPNESFQSFSTHPLPSLSTYTRASLRLFPLSTQHGHPHRLLHRHTHNHTQADTVSLCLHKMETPFPFDTHARASLPFFLLSTQNGDTHPSLHTHTHLHFFPSFYTKQRRQRQLLRRLIQVRHRHAIFSNRLWSVCKCHLGPFLLRPS